MSGEGGEVPYVPTYSVVQKQLQELVLYQQFCLEKSRKDISTQNSLLKESFVSKEQHQLALQSLEGRWIVVYVMAKIRNQYVGLESYDALFRQLEDEKLEHAKTKSKLMEVSERLEFSQGEIEVLTKQLDREKAAFQQAFGSIRDKAMKETSRNIHLEKQCSDMKKRNADRKNILESKEKDIHQLEKTLKEQNDIYQKRMKEMEVQLKQEQYIYKMLDQSDRNTAKRKKAV